MSADQSPQSLIRDAEAHLANAQPDQAVSLFEKVLASRPRDSAAWRGLGKAQLDLGDVVGAQHSFARALAIVPYDRYAAHMNAALAGQTDQATTGYVADLFDTYADRFDDHLTGTLNYRIPQAIAALLAPHAPLGSMLDLGCGTGLVAAALKDMASPIDGIDLAPNMTRKARERGIYRHLFTADVVEALNSEPALTGPYDLVTAADVFVYIGAMDESLAAIAKMLSSGGLFVFSVENAQGDAVRLQSSGRFAHPAAYIDSKARQFGFTVLDRQAHTIRQERDMPIAGTLYMLARV